MDQIVE